MEQLPSGNEEQDPRISEIPELLEAPYEGDDLFIFERRLAEQIKHAPVEHRWDIAAVAKERINAHYSEHIGRLLFATAHLAIALIPNDEGGPSGKARAFHGASISGTIERMNVLSLSEEQHHVSLELSGATVYYTDEDADERMVFESKGPVLVPIGAVTSHQLL